MRNVSIIQRMIRDIKLWFLLRWLDVVTLYTSKKNADSPYRDPEDDYIRYGGRTNYVNFLYFDYNYSGYNFFLKYLGGLLPYFLMKRFLAKLESDVSMVEILFPGDDSSFLTDTDYKGVLKVFRYAHKQGYIESCDENEDKNFIGLSIDGEGVATYSGFFRNMTKHLPFVTAVITLGIYLWSVILGYLTEIPTLSALILDK